MTDQIEDNIPTGEDDVAPAASETDTPDAPQAAAATLEAATETEDADGDDENDEPTQAARAIAAMGLTRMSLQELKDKSPADLLALAEQLEVESANSMRKQDMMFAILKTLAEEGVEIEG